MSFRSAAVRFRFVALAIAAVAAVGVAGAMLLEPWWQRLLSFLGVGGLAYFAWIFAVFEFAKRTRPILDAAGGDTTPLERWAGRWMGLTFAALAVVAALGMWQIVVAHGWPQRIALFFAVGGPVAFAGMGAVFCFCAIPQVHSSTHRNGNTP
ncbi:MAG: hypothetical protein AB8H80_04975 [Planctomycetota bacterium]